MMASDASRSAARTVAILFGRKGSEGFPGKNLHPILGRPASLYPLLAARHAKVVDRVYVSTDDDEIVALGRGYGANHLTRPAQLCTKDALIEDAIEHAYHQVVELQGHPPRYVVILLANSCNILADVIDRGARMLDARPDLDSVITAAELNMYTPLRARRLSGDGVMEPFVPLTAFGNVAQMNCDRGSAGDCYFADGGMTIVRGEFLSDMKNNLLPFRWMGRRIGMIDQLPGGGDIDQGWQIAAMEYWLRQHGFSETATPYEPALVAR